MTDEQKAAYIQAMIACVNVEVAAMQAENTHRLNCGNSIAYGEEAFLALIEKYGVHHNAVLGVLQS